MSEGAALLERLPAGPRRWVLESGTLAGARGESAWLVGGTVRDLMLERPGEDLDVVVVGDGMAVAQAFARAQSGKLTRYHAFGTARVDLPDGQRVDFATARAELYPRPGDLPRVEPGTLAEDLARRDFSINAIALGLTDPDVGRIADPFDGAGDLRRQTIRFLHEGSFRDDPTRTLRALRFALRFGYRLEESTERALRDAAHGGYLGHISEDRLRRELGKLLAEAPVEGPLRLAETGMLDGIGAGLRAGRSELERLSAGWGGRPDEPPDRWTLVLALLAEGLEPQERWALARRLRLSREQREPLIEAGAPWRRLLEAVTDPDRAPIAVVEAADEVGAAALAVGLATVADAALRDRVREASRRARESRPEIGGDALIELGCVPGPPVGAMLRRLRQAHLAGRVGSAEDEAALAAAWLADSGN